MTNDAFVLNWVLEKVKTEYADDIALVLGHTKFKHDAPEQVFSYFVPRTERGEQFAQTFILCGEGMDIWAIRWERLEKFASLEEYNTHVLAGAEVIYARSDEELARFETLRQKQLANLADVTQSRRRALESYAQAKTIYTELLFAKGGDIKMCAGYVLDYLARAVAFSQNRYFHKMQIDQLRELDELPEGFAKRYNAVIMASNDDLRKKLCHELIEITAAYLEEIKPPEPPKTPTIQDLAGWYMELSYTWLRIRRYAAQNDAVKVYMWGIMLQQELGAVCGEFGLEKMDLMCEFDSEDLAAFVRHADALEIKMRSIITANGGVIRDYASFEEFLHEV